MLRLRLIHWKQEELVERAARLRGLGCEVDAGAFGPETLRELRREPPDGVVIDLGRLPAQGRDVGVALRTAAATRRVPLVFVGGAPAKVERTQETLPDAVYTTWEEIGEALPGALAAPPADPVVPEHALAGYSGTPLPKKLGIKPGARVLLMAAPEGFEETLGELPEGARLLLGGEPPRDRAPELAIWFVRSLAELTAGIGRGQELAAGGGLWIAWPKQASGVTTDVTQQAVRETGLAAGLVDHKICAVDATWSALRFAVRRR